MAVRPRIPLANKIGLGCVFGAWTLYVFRNSHRVSIESLTSLRTMITRVLYATVTLSIDFTDFTFAAKGAHI